MKDKDFDSGSKCCCDLEETALHEDETVEKELNAENLSFRQLFSYSPLTSEEQRQLANKASAGDKAAEKILVLSNMKLVAKIAGEYTDCGIPFTDLCQEGAIGLLLAIRRYNTESSASLATYASHWIRKMILMHINKCARLIKLPENKVELWITVKKETAIFYQNNYRMPSADELSLSMGLSVEIIKEVLGYIKMEPISVDEWNSIKEAEYMADDHYAKLKEETILYTHREESIHDAINKLDEKHRKVIIGRYGLFNERRQSLKELAISLGVSRQRVYQIQKESEAILRELLSELT